MLTFQERMEDFNDIEIAKRAKKDIKAFEVLYEYYLPKIFGYCLNRIASYSDAEDVTSKVFLSAIENLNNFDTEKGIKFGSWLYRIAHNKIIDFYRSNKSFKNAPLEEVETIHLDDNDRTIEISEKQKQIAKVLADLPERYQEIISLKFYTEFSNLEIAAIWKSDNKKVALVLHRAVKAFEKKYREMFPMSEIK